LERGTPAARLAAVAAPFRPTETVSLFTAPALGQRWSAGRGAPGYLLARFQGGRLAALDERNLEGGEPAPSRAVTGHPRLEAVSR
jgi:hypothetical protein